MKTGPLSFRQGLISFPSPQFEKDVGVWAGFLAKKGIFFEQAVVSELRKGILTPFPPLFTSRDTCYSEEG